MHQIFCWVCFFLFLRIDQGEAKYKRMFSPHLSRSGTPFVNYILKSSCFVHVLVCVGNLGSSHLDRYKDIYLSTVLSLLYKYMFSCESTVHRLYARMCIYIYIYASVCVCVCVCVCFLLFVYYRLGGARVCRGTLTVNDTVNGIGESNSNSVRNSWYSFRAYSPGVGITFSSSLSFDK